MATVATVIEQVKWAADRQRGGRLATASLLAVATRIYREAWEIVINACRDRYVKDATSRAGLTLTGAAGSTSILITETDFYALYDGQRSAVQRVSGTEYLDIPVYRRESARLSYRWEADTIFFEGDCAGTYTYRYVYKPADLVDANSTIVDFNGWIEALLVDGLTLRAKMRDEEDPALIPALLQNFESRVQRYATARAAPQRVIDVRSRRRRSEEWDY